MTLAIVFWICVALIAYTYAFYPILLLAAYSIGQLFRDLRYLAGRADRRAPRPAEKDWPAVTMIVPARNEAAHLPAKIRNLFEIDYPQDKLEVIFLSDGSTDQTNQMLAAIQAPFVRTIFLQERGGKAAALNRGVAEAKHEIAVFSDASTLLDPDAIRNLVRHFTKSTVGVVCGALRFKGSASSQETEGVYWKYESILRLMEGRLGATLTASGALYAIRKNCYQKLPANTLVDDLVVPMHARKLSFGVVYDPEARAIDYAANSVEAEFRRRVRIAMGSFRALPEILCSHLPGLTLFAFFSHKVLRWLLPFLLLGALVTNFFLLSGALYSVTLAAQLALLLWTMLGALESATRRLPLVRFTYYLSAMNFAFLVGLLRVLRNRRGHLAW
jgi:cellulose synthase/poly-beta-1,6-N-acetylglucosamine synthase-like glycosyltransferase